MTDVADCELPTTEDLVGHHLDAIRKQASELCRLPVGWDHASAAVVDPVAAALAVRVAASVTCPECLAPVLSPTVAGNVLIDWTWGDDHVEIEVAADGRLEVLVEVSGTNVEFETNADNDDHLAWLAHQVTGVGFGRFTPRAEPA